MIMDKSNKYYVTVIVLSDPKRKMITMKRKLSMLKPLFTTKWQY